MKKRKPATGKIQNRRARFDYELTSEIIAGLVLSGKEAKSLRQGRAQLRGAYVTFKNEQLILINSTISSGKTFIIDESDQTRARQLLVSKKQIKMLLDAKVQGNTIVPLEFITNGPYIKLKIAIGKGKKRYDKRQTIKKREQQREIAR